MKCVRFFIVHPVFGCIKQKSKIDFLNQPYRVLVLLELQLVLELPAECLTRRRKRIQIFHVVVNF